MAARQIYPASNVSPVRRDGSSAPMARISSVTPDSPADDAGFYAGCSITEVDGEPLRDVIDWRWKSASASIEVTYLDGEGDVGTVELERDSGEEWGFEFESVVFDSIKLCRNACTFCFMRQLPADVRPSLVLRDDDFRLSFLQGTFVTLTNLTPEDEARIIEQHLSPLRVSLHAATPELRRSLIGKHAAHGIAAAERLLAAGIEMHMQIVLLPGVNDGEELKKTLDWAWEYPGIQTIGIVPIGFTKHQTIFEKSFNDVSDARGVIECVVPFQQRALKVRHTPWVFAADEFYRNAYPHDLLDHLPPTSYYGDFDMFEDGIGIIRSFVDDWQKSGPCARHLAEVLDRAAMRVHCVVGYAQREFLLPLLEQSPLTDKLTALPVKNEYFGGNVDVTGLLCGCDIAASLGALDEVTLAVVPEVVFNDDGVTLDDMTLEDIAAASGVRVAVVSCNPSEYFDQIRALVADLP